MKWTLKNSITKFKGFFKLLEYEYEVERFNGGTLTLTREVFERGTAAAVLAYDPNQDSVVLVEQFRSGAMHTRNPWLVELIAGMIEPDEEPQNVVMREALEEAGCELSNITPMLDYLVSPGGTTESVSLFVATCDSTCVADVAGLEEEGEDIKVHVISRAKFMQQLQAGQINNAMTLIAAQWLALNFDAWQASGFSDFKTTQAKP